MRGTTESGFFKAVVKEIYGLLLLHFCLKSVTHCLLWTCQDDRKQSLIYPDKFTCCSVEQDKWYSETSSQNNKQLSLIRKKLTKLSQPHIIEVK